MGEERGLGWRAAVAFEVRVGVVGSLSIIAPSFGTPNDDVRYRSTIPGAIIAPGGGIELCLRNESLAFSTGMDETRALSGVVGDGTPKSKPASDPGVIGSGPVVIAVPEGVGTIGLKAETPERVLECRNGSVRKETVDCRAPARP